MKNKNESKILFDLSTCFFNPKNGKPYTYEQICILQDYDGPRTDPNAILKNYDNDLALIDYLDDKAIREANAKHEIQVQKTLFPEN
ncbi:hypothetical protein [Nonlabens antarcticus]|uniref:hypothetical protein n=1 Tax=Nonlabens antarcticus TaxID=392714 RepID=UPI001891F2A3|nr:hypothetical protein [Nonlabens antarcticus]